MKTSYIFLTFDKQPSTFQISTGHMFSRSFKKSFEFYSAMHLNNWELKPE